MTEPILSPDKFYLLVNSSGYFIKTRSKEEFDEVSTWGNIIFSGLVKNSETLFFKVGSNNYHKKINQLPVAKPRGDMLWYDVEVLDLKGGLHISSAGLQEKGETYENL